MKKLFFIFPLLCISFLSFAQTAAKSVYVELGGPGLASLNYDMRLQKKDDGLGFRVGIGGFSEKFDDNNGGSEKLGILAVPLELNYLLGRDNRNYFEIGAGYSIVTVSDKSSNGSFESDEFNSSFGHLYFGYRLQPANGGFLFRAGIVPVFGKGYFIPYYAGISFGYKF